MSDLEGRSSPSTDRWKARLRFAIDAVDAAEAENILYSVLGRMGVEALGTSTVECISDSVWTTATDVDLSGLGVVEPDTAKTRALYVIRQTDAAWRITTVSETELIYEWPPAAWLEQRNPAIMLHASVRTALIRVGQAPAG
jgi:hypothetical protein